MQEKQVQLNKEVIDLIAPIVANDIGVKVLDGINWALVNNRHVNKQKKYGEIRAQLNNMGFKPTEVFRVFSVPNGVVYDFDKVVLKSLVSEFVKDVPDGDCAVKRINSAYSKRRYADMQRLADYVVAQAQEGQKEALVALFSKTNNFEIKFHTRKEGTKRKAYSLPAFAIRHWDLQELNVDYIIPRGYLVEKIEIVEILPAENGISFMLHFKEFTEK